MRLAESNSMKMWNGSLLFEKLRNTLSNDAETSRIGNDFIHYLLTYADNTSHDHCLQLQK